MQGGGLVLEHSYIQCIAQCAVKRAYLCVLIDICIYPHMIYTRLAHVHILYKPPPAPRVILLGHRLLRCKQGIVRRPPTPARPGPRCCADTEALSRYPSAVIFGTRGPLLWVTRVFRYNVPAQNVSEHNRAQPGFLRLRTA